MSHTRKKLNELNELLEDIFEEQLISRGICTWQCSPNLSQQSVFYGEQPSPTVYENKPKSIAKLILKVICSLLWLNVT